MWESSVLDVSYEYDAVIDEMGPRLKAHFQN